MHDVVDVGVRVGDVEFPGYDSRGGGGDEAHVGHELGVEARVGLG